MTDGETTTLTPRLSQQKETVLRLSLRMESKVEEAGTTSAGTAVRYD